MGYNVHSILALRDLVDMGVIFPKCSILEFGAQEAQGDAFEIRNALQALSDHMSLGIHVPELTSPVDMSAMYRLLGFTHKAIDVNCLHGSEFFDLNTQRVKFSDRGKYDWVNNEGTTEHVINQFNAFRAAHDYCKPGGHISNSCPVIGWVDHGLMNATPKFWAILAGENRYRTASKLLIETDKPHTLPEWYDGWAGSDITYPDVWGHFIFQKMYDAPFVIPVDHLEFDEDGLVAKRLKRLASDTLMRSLPLWRQPLERLRNTGSLLKRRLTA